MGEQPLAGESYVHASGIGPPAVLVHGTFVGGLESFAAQAPLADRHRLREVFARAPSMSAGDWSRLWLTRVAGLPEEGAAGWMATWGEREWAMADVVRRERWAGEAPVDTGVLAAAGFPKLLVVGAKAPPSGGTPALAVGQAMVEALVRRVGAEVVVFEDSGHLAPLEEPDRFNDLLRATWAVPGSGGKW